MNGSFVTFVVGSVRHSSVCGFDGVGHPASTRTGSNPVQSGAEAAGDIAPCQLLGTDAKRRHHLGDHKRAGGADPALPSC